MFESRFLLHWQIIYSLDFYLKTYYIVRNMTKIMQASQVRQEWSNILNTIYKENSKVIVEKSGIPVAAIISSRELEQFNRYQEEQKERLKLLDDIRSAFKDVPDEELEREVNKAVVEVRSEMRAEKTKKSNN